MATYTGNYNLKKPATTDQVNIEDLNGNADIIDAALANKADAADVSGKYTKPETGIPATDLAADVQASLGKADTAVQATEKGATNGVATLDGAGKVPAAQLPSYVDDVIEGYYYNGAFYSDAAHTTQITAETGKIYVDIDTSKSYRYSGSAFYRIDEITVDATPAEGSSNPVSSGGVYTALAGKVDKVAGKGLSTLDFTVADRQAISNAYVKPTAGVPKTDLSQDVQTSLDKADNSLQAALDETLTVQGAAADAKATGDAVGELKSAVDCKAPAIFETASGASATFPDGAADMPLKSLTVNIEPVQEGSGDPSPTNVRPISGWTGANVTTRGKNLCDCEPSITLQGEGGIGAKPCRLKAGVTYTWSYTTNNICAASLTLRKADNTVVQTINTPSSQSGLYSLTFVCAKDCERIGCYFNTAVTITNFMIESGSTATAYEAYEGNTYNYTFPSPDPGTVYGGTLDVTTGVLTVDMESAKYDGTEEWYLSSTYRFYMYGQAEILKCSQYYKYQVAIDYASEIPSGTFARAASGVSYIADDRYNSVSEWAAHLAELYSAGTPLQVVRKLATPQTYQLTPTEVTTLLGTNNIWADTGDVTAEYPADTKLYIDSKITQAIANALNS